MARQCTLKELKGYVIMGAKELTLNTPKNQIPKSYQILAYHRNATYGNTTGVLLRSKTGKMYVAFGEMASILRGWGFSDI